MLIAAKKVFRSAIAALDGPIGSVDDVYFSDELWNVRYLVVDTGHWLPGRRVLLAPASILAPNWHDGTVEVKLTRQQVVDSPPSYKDKPISRKYELELNNYFGWPSYWADRHRPMPSLGLSAVGDEFEELGRLEVEPKEASVATERHTGPELQSAQEVKRYRIAAQDGEIGHVDDLIMDDEHWVIRYFVVDTRNWIPGHKVLLSPAWIEWISCPGQKVHVNLTREQVRESPKFSPSAGVNREYEEHLYDYYGREKYWH